VLGFRDGESADTESVTGRKKLRRNEISPAKMYYETLWREVKSVFGGGRGDGDAGRSLYAYGFVMILKNLFIKSCGKPNPLTGFPARPIIMFIQNPCRRIDYELAGSLRTPILAKFAV
jgi:hypothetical protein